MISRGIRRRMGRVANFMQWSWLAVACELPGGGKFGVRVFDTDDFKASKGVRLSLVHP